MKILIDTGPLYAFFNKRDEWNLWVGKTLGACKPPLYTCESVISETIFLLQRSSMEISGLMELMTRKHLIIQPAFKSTDDQRRVQEILENYQNIPASFADACLVRMAEVHVPCKLMTLDSDFSIYRKNDGKAIDLISPF